MDLLTRLRLRRLTRAVYRGDVGSAAPEKRVLRILPSPVSVLALVLLLLLLALIGIVRDRLPGDAHAIEAESARSEQAHAVAALREGPSQAEGAATDGGGAVDAPTATGESNGRAGRVLVHVAGAVGAPGVVDLPLGSRVIDAIGAAGGPAGEADLDALNLARRVDDGERVLVPRIGETAPSGAEPIGAGQAPDPIGAAGSCVDIRTADAAALESLDGIGPRLAERIVAFRQSSGPFESVEDLDAVPGIGPALLARVREGVCR